MSSTLRFRSLFPKQASDVNVFSFVASAKAISTIARIERAGRDSSGALHGFQRPQIEAHIRNIRDYLGQASAILPNAIIVAFTDNARVIKETGDWGWLEIDTTQGPPGWIVDGQQRFTALGEAGRDDFEVLVSGFLCESAEELQKQFVLVNSARPLPKALVYELLPRIGKVPEHLTSRSRAALLTEALNYRRDSSLFGLIKQQTNPTGLIADTVLHKLLMNSMTDGALRLYAGDQNQLLDHGYRLVSEFFSAVQHVFSADWNGHTPKTSRLLHGTGINAMGYVMESIHSRTGAQDRTSFALGLKPLVGRTAWTSGEWNFGDELRRWNGLQNVGGDVKQLSLYLVRVLTRAQLRAQAA